MATLEQQLAQLQQANAQLLAAVNAQTAEVGAKMGQIDARVQTADQQVDQFVTGARREFVGSAARDGVIDQAPNRLIVKLPSISAGAESLSINIIDRWRTGNWGNSDNCILHVYLTYYYGSYARYHWSGNTITLLDQTSTSAQPNFSLTDHGQQGTSGGQPTVRESLNLELPAYQNAFVVLEALSYNRFFGNDQAGTMDSGFGGGGSALIFKTLTNTELGV